MTLRTLFERQVFVRLSEDRSAFICTTQWSLFAKVFSKTKRIGVAEAAHDRASQAEANK
jgi:hypothetical protein